MDLTKLSDAQLSAIQSGDYSKLSDAELHELSGVPASNITADSRTPSADKTGGQPQHDLMSDLTGAATPEAARQEADDYTAKLAKWDKSNPGFLSRLFGIGAPMPAAQERGMRLYSRMASPLAAGGTQAILAAAKALGGKVPDQPVGTPSLIDQALSGTYPGSIQALKQGGVSAPIATGAGILFDAMSDPIGGGAKTLEGLSAVGPALNKLGRKIYGMPLNKMEAQITAGIKGDLPKGATTDLMYENDIGKGADNIGYGKQMDALRKQKGAEIGQVMKDVSGSDKINLAPGLEDAAEALKNQSMEDEESANKVSGMDYLKQLLGGNKAQRAQGMELLRTNVDPEFAPLLDRIEKGLSVKESKPAALDVATDFIDNLAEGPKTPEELQTWKVAAAQKANKSLPMQGSAYNRAGMYNQGQSLEAELADHLGNGIENIVGQKLADVQAAANAGEAVDPAVLERLKNFAQTKQDYAGLRRGQSPVWNAIKQQEGRPAMSKLDLMTTSMGAGMAAGGNPKLAAEILAAEAAAKFGQALHQSPAFAAKIGLGLKGASQSNLWDAILRTQGAHGAVNGENK